MLDHTLTACMEFKRDVTFESALKVLDPLIKLFGWTSPQVVQDEPLRGQDFIQAERDGEFIYKLTIYTAGAVQNQLWEVIPQLANELGVIAKLGTIRLEDHDTANPDGAVKTYWYGEPAAVALAKKSAAWEKAKLLLVDSGVADDTLQVMSHCLKDEPAEAAATMCTVLSQAQRAMLFFDELRETYGCLSKVASRFGYATVRDLFYLHNAILQGALVEHAIGESHLRVVVSQLPSHAIWKTFILPL